MYFNIVRATAMQNGDEALPSIILAGDQFAFAFYTLILLAVETNLSTFNTGCALYCQLILYVIPMLMNMQTVFLKLYFP